MTNIFHVFGEVYVLISKMWICLFFHACSYQWFWKGLISIFIHRIKYCKNLTGLGGCLLSPSLFYVLFKSDSTSPPRSTIWSHFPSQIPPQELFLLQKVSQQNFLHLNTSEIVTHFQRNCGQRKSFSSYCSGNFRWKEMGGLLVVVPWSFIFKPSCYRRVWVIAEATGPQLTLIRSQSELIKWTRLNHGTLQALFLIAPPYELLHMCKQLSQKWVTLKVRRPVLTVQNGSQSFIRFIHSSIQRQLHKFFLTANGRDVSPKTSWRW